MQNAHFKMFLFASILTAFACTNNQLENNRSSITSIEVATGYCHGDCSFTAIQIDKSFNYKYYGGVNAKKQCYYAGKIDSKLWDNFTDQLVKIKYRKLDSIYNNTVDDQSIELIIHDKNGIKHIRAQSESLPPYVSKVFYQIANSYTKVKLAPSNHIIYFNTTAQKFPKIQNPQFPPSTKMN